MSQAQAAELNPRIREEIDRAVQRGLVGMEYVSIGETDVGLTPKDTIHARGTMKLYHYRATTDEIYRVPVLMVMSLITKPYILDLTPGQSLVEYLVNQGFDVFLIDWGIPRKEDKHLRLEDYALDFIPDCIRKVQEAAGEEDVSLVGYCMGGLLAALYLALHPEGPAKNFAAFAMPVDFDHLPLFKQWADPRFFDVDRVVDELGNIPADLLQTSFDMLRPASKVAAPARLFDKMWEDEFVRAHLMLDRWASDHIPFPGEAFRQCTKELAWKNALVKNQFELAGRRVDLDAITIPCLHVMAKHDHITPPASGQPFIQLIGSEDKEEVILKGGHVSLVAGGNAIYRLWPQLERWLGRRSA